MQRGQEDTVNLKVTCLSIHWKEFAVENDHTRIVGKGRLYSQMSFIYKYKISRGFLIWVFYVSYLKINDITHNPGPTLKTVVL